MRYGIIRLAAEEDLRSVKELWRECFTTDSAYLDLVFGKLYPLAVLFVFEGADGILSSAFLIPVRYKNENENESIGGYYLYGVCTQKTARGKGLAKSVIEYATDYAEKAGGGFVLTRPATGTLFGYYRELGFHVAIKRGMKTCSFPTVFPEHHTNVPTDEISAEELFRLRGKTFPNLFEWDERMLDIIRQAVLLSGGAILASDRIGRGRYMAVEADPQDDTNMLITESDIEDIETCKENIARNAAGFTRSWQSLTFIFPSYYRNVSFDSIEDYALLKPLNNIPERIFKESFFNFAME